MLWQQNTSLEGVVVSAPGEIKQENQKQRSGIPICVVAAQDLSCKTLVD